MVSHRHQVIRHTPTPNPRIPASSRQPASVIPEPTVISQRDVKSTFVPIFDRRRGLTSKTAKWLLKLFKEGNEDKGLRGWNWHDGVKRYTSIRVFQIFKINPPAHQEAAFKTIERSDIAKGYSDTSTLLWHGTSCLTEECTKPQDDPDDFQHSRRSCVFASIASNGFRNDKPICFSPHASYALQFTQTDPFEYESVLLCKVLKGNSSQHASHTTVGKHDSTSFFGGAAVSLNNPERILPLYVMSFKRR